MVKKSCLFHLSTRSSPRQEASKFCDSLLKRIPCFDTKVQAVEYNQIEYVIVSVRIDIGFEKNWKAPNLIVVGSAPQYLRVVVGFHCIS